MIRKTFFDKEVMIIIMIKGIIFDLDGTLLDTLDDLTAAVNHALGAFGLGSLTRGDVRAFVGDGVAKLMERAINFVKTGKSDGEKPDELSACLALFTEYYDAHNADLTKPYDGVSELLAQVKAAGLKSAIVTNKYDGAAQKLKVRFFPTVDVIIGARPDLRPKPAPDGVKAALDVLGLTPSECVYVGDGETDMKTARACAMPAVAVTWGFRDGERLKAFSPQIIINSPSELLAALNNGGLL